MGDAFDPAKMGSEPSFLIAAWLTPKVLAGVAALGGCVDSNSPTGIGWRWLSAGTGATLAMGLSNGGTAVVDLQIPNALEINVPKLFTMACVRTGAGTYSLRGYMNGALAGSVNGAYPFAVISAPARFGFVTGASGVQNFALHRARSRKFDPAYFDIAAWHTAEIAANGGRWA